MLITTEAQIAAQLDPRSLCSPCWMNPCAEVGGILGPGGCMVLWDMWAGGTAL